MTTSSSTFNNHVSLSQFNEYYLPCINRNTFEKVDSKTAFKQKFKQTIFEQDTLHIILGIDSGLLVNYLLDAPIAEGSKYIFIELQEVLSLLNIDIPKEKQSYIKVMNLEEFTALITSNSEDLFLIKGHFKVTLSLAASTGIIKEYSQAFSDVSHLLTRYITSIKANLNQKLFFKEQLLNIADNKQKASLLSNKFSNKTCLVVGGGPSLDENIDWIKQHYNELFILTVSRFASKLSDLGIPAHIIVSIDPQEHSFEVNRDMMRLANESLLINSHHICHRILAQWQGKSLYLGDKLPWEKTNNIPTVGPTVTNSAIRIAIEMGFSQILLTGVDFCHSSTGATHAKGSLEAKAGSDNSKINQWVETNSGELAETPIQLFYAAEALKLEVIQFPNVNIINLAKGAARIDGISYKKTEDIKIIPASCSTKQLLEMVPMNAQKSTQELYKLTKELQAVLKAFNSITKLSKEALALNKSVKKLNPNCTQYQQKIAKIDSIEAKINNKMYSYAQLIKTYGYYEFSQFLSTKNTDDWSYEHMNTMTNKYYLAFSIISEHLSELIQNAVDIIATRIEELNEHPDLSILSKNWHQFQQQGRVHIWQNMATPETLSTLTANAQSLIDVLQQSYQHQLTSMEHAYFSMEKNYQNLDKTLAKIIDLNQNKNIPGLKLLSERIRPLMKNDEYATKLFHLIEHYVYVLQDNNEAALASLLAIEEDKLTEFELKQLLVITLKLHQLERAEITLKKLTQYSDEYLPQHAHVLSLQGENQLALDMYLDYLDKYPQDESVLIKLGVFLAGINQIEEAKSVFNQVNHINPDNKTAKGFLEQLDQGTTA